MVLSRDGTIIHQMCTVDAPSEDAAIGAAVADALKEHKHYALNSVKSLDVNKTPLTQ